MVRSRENKDSLAGNTAWMRDICEGEMDNIGLIAARQTYESLRSTIVNLQKKYNLKLLIYSTLEELEPLYMQNLETVDGFFFTGPLPYRYLKENIGDFGALCEYADVSEGDLYRLLTKVLAANRNLDLSKVYIDMGRDIDSLHDIFPADNCPRCMMSHKDEEILKFNPDMYDVIAKNYIGKWRNGELSMIISRFTNVISRIDSHKIPYALLLPSEESLHGAFDRLMREIAIRRLDSSLVAFVIIKRREGSDITDASLEKALEEFNSLHNMPYIVRRNGDVMEMTTSNRIFKKHTENYSRLKVHDYLKNMFGEAFLCAGGVGADAVSARMNSLHAMREAMYHPEHPPIIIDGDNRVIYPKGIREGELDYSDEIRTMAAAMEISPLNMQRIVSLAEKTASNYVTSEELASYIGIRQRSAARILSKLVNAGGASLVQSKATQHRGRPLKVYELHLNITDSAHASG